MLLSPGRLEDARNRALSPDAQQEPRTLPLGVVHVVLTLDCGGGLERVKHAVACVRLRPFCGDPWRILVKSAAVSLFAGPTSAVHKSQNDVLAR
jgi:hypothetical protein